jgi:hypothetical protein
MCYNSTMRNLDGWYLTRWRILERDRFTCQYCGQRAPDVILHVDHKAPVSEGGSDDDDNLVTSCWACNVGKSNWLASLGDKPYTPRLRRSSLATALIAYLAEHGPSTATEIARATDHNRCNISGVLANDERFTFVGKRGRDALYATILAD